MTFDKRAYDNEWKARKRAKKKAKRLLDKNRCPICEMKLDSRFHTDCPYNSRFS